MHFETFLMGVITGAALGGLAVALVAMHMARGKR